MIREIAVLPPKTRTDLPCYNIRFDSVAPTKFEVQMDGDKKTCFQWYNNGKKENKQKKWENARKR